METTLQQNGKIKTIEELAKLLDVYRSETKKIVHCHGVFDRIHIGHIRYFEQARLLGDILVVTVTPDCFVDKGPHRPAFAEKLRAEAIASLSSVDYVAINQWTTAEETLRLLRPDFYVKGSEFKKSYSGIGSYQKIKKGLTKILKLKPNISITINSILHKPDKLNEMRNFFNKNYPGINIKVRFVDQHNLLNPDLEYTKEQIMGYKKEMRKLAKEYINFIICKFFFPH